MQSAELHPKRSSTAGLNPGKPPVGATSRSLKADQCKDEQNQGAPDNCRRSHQRLSYQPFCTSMREKLQKRHSQHSVRMPQLCSGGARGADAKVARLRDLRRLGGARCRSLCWGERPVPVARLSRQPAAIFLCSNKIPDTVFQSQAMLAIRSWSFSKARKQLWLSLLSHPLQCQARCPKR